MKNVSILLILLLAQLTFAAQPKDVRIKLIQTSDVHGNYFPYDFIRQQQGSGSLARVHSMVSRLRQSYGDNLLLFDNGDIIQGQPAAYYYNYIDTSSVHLCSEVMNFMRFDVGTIGNHDIETGHSVYDKWIEACQFPMLGANVIDINSGKPYLKPYHTFHRDGIKITVLGMVTPAIPCWLHEELWQGLYFEDMEECARKWMPIIQKKEKPDLVIGLFHSGQQARTTLGKYREDASAEVAQRVPGFDIVLIGHDHTLCCRKINNVRGDSVLVINPGFNATHVAEVDISIKKRRGVAKKQISGKLTAVADYPVSKEFMEQFASQYDSISSFVSQKIGTISESLPSRPAYFGSSAFVDLIHTIQLDISGADISMASPLSFDIVIEKGDITISDMFKLYEYENFLCTMHLSGNEIKSILEESYSIWTNQMKSPDDHMILFGEQNRSSSYLANYYFLFDSAAGIQYTVDVTRPKGEKIAILSMADGSPFDPEKIYTVAVTSYRGSGGGEMLTKGAGLTQEMLRERIVNTTEKDLRYYMIEYIKRKRDIDPKPLNHWKFIPEEWTKPAIYRDYNTLFQSDNSQ